MQNVRKFPKNPESGELTHLYEFGPFRVDPVKRLLLRVGEPVSLTPKAFDILLALIAKSGQVLLKDELMKSIWPDTVVEEGNLNRNISTLRKALGETPDEHRYIVTIPGRGYRFVAEVRERWEEVGAKSGVRSPESGVGSRESGVHLRDSGLAVSEGSATGSGQFAVSSFQFPHLFRAGLVLFCGAILALTLLLGFNVRGWRDKLSGRAAAELVQSVAVLPLQNLSGDPAQEYFVDGMTDELITDLAQIGALRVISHTSVMQYKGTRKPLPEIARELNVDAVVEGSVRRSGDRVRITAQLVRTAPETHLWAHTYEDNLSDVLSLQAEVARAIAQQVRVKLTPQEQAHLATSHPVNREAYDAYLQGRFSWNKRSPEGLSKGIEYFTRAIEKDPSYALAYAGLADCYALRGFEGEEGGEAMPRAKAAALKALELDGSLAEAHTSLGGVKAIYDWDWAGAEEEFKQALGLNPGYSPAHHWYATLYLAPQGRYAEAIDELKRARELDPVSLIINTDLGWAYYIARQFDRALEQYQRTVAMDPNFLPLRFRLYQYYAQRGMFKEAMVERGKWLNLAGFGEQAIAGDPGRSGDTALARESYANILRGELQHLKKELGRGHEEVYSFAETYARLGESDQAIAWLEKVYEKRFPGLIYLKADPVWDPLRADPRFQDLVRRIGLRGEQ